jgi:hypothetical protein
MLTRTIAAMATAGLLAGLSQAHATGPNDIFCKVRDSAGNNLTYTFGANTENKNGSIGGTFVETGFAKNGVSQFSAPGQRPIWIFGVNNWGGLTISSRSALGWAIVQGAITDKDGVFGAEAWLYHNNAVIASGGCIRNHSADTADTVPDQGW